MEENLHQLIISSYSDYLYTRFRTSQVVQDFFHQQSTVSLSLPFVRHIFSGHPIVVLRKQAEAKHPKCQLGTGSDGPDGQDGCWDAKQPKSTGGVKNQVRYHENLKTHLWWFLLFSFLMGVGQVWRQFEMLSFVEFAFSWALLFGQQLRSPTPQHAARVWSDSCWRLIFDHPNSWNCLGFKE